MPSYKRFDGSTGFHVNPQAAKSMGAKPAESSGGKAAHNSEENVGAHKFHHVEIHHGGHPEGSPPMHEGTTHHTIAHHHSESGSEPEIKNHESAQEAGESAGRDMDDTNGQDSDQMADLTGAGADDGGEVAA